MPGKTGHDINGYRVGRRMENTESYRELKKRMDLPDKVSIVEVGPRDGLQMEPHFLPTEHKVSVICRLIEAGIKYIQVASFVHPQRVPQMADAEAVLQQLPEKPGVLYNGLALNARGVDRAGMAGLKSIEVSLSASDAHSRKNTGLSYEEAVQESRAMIRLAKSYQMHIRASIQCAFGCAYGGRIKEAQVIDLVRTYIDQGADWVVAADTTGMANPLSVRSLTEKLLEVVGPIPLVLHFHDTRGIGLANVLAALQTGVTYFDTAMGGMGGCPFVQGAAGNIATEDTVYLMEALGIATGIDIRQVSQCSRQMEAFFDKHYPGKMHRLEDPAVSFG
jgi:hydroxymethylglutaryl-CoA lyase